MRPSATKEDIERFRKLNAEENPINSLKSDAANNGMSVNPGTAAYDQIPKNRK